MASTYYKDTKKYLRGKEIERADIWNPYSTLGDLTGLCGCIYTFTRQPTGRGVLRTALTSNLKIRTIQACHIFSVGRTKFVNL